MHDSSKAYAAPTGDWVLAYGSIGSHLVTQGWGGVFVYIGRVDAADTDKFNIRRCLRYLIAYKDRTEAAESLKEFLHIGNLAQQTWMTGSCIQG